MNAEQQPEDFMQPSEMSNLMSGPMSLVVDAVRNKMPILVNLRSNRKVLGIPKAVDRHWNIILEQTREFWSTEERDKKTGASFPKVHHRNLGRIFLRGDNVICVVPNPQGNVTEEDQQNE